MKIFLSIFILGALLLNTFSKSLIVVSFYANQDYYAKHLCVNRSHPEMHCNGKCCLHRKLEKENGQNTTPLPTSLRNITEIVLMQAEKTDFCFTSFFLNTVQFPDRVPALSPSCRDDIFHPPTLVG